MKTHLLFLSLLLPAVAFCTNQNQDDPHQNQEEPQGEPWQDQVFERNVDDPLDEVLTELPPEILPGITVQATRPYVENFLTEVHYPDHDYTTAPVTRVLEFDGGFNDADATDYPVYNADKPAMYTIRWTADASVGDLVLTLKDGSWSQQIKVAAGKDYQVISNLRPGANYTYEVKGAHGSTMTSGTFKTTGSLHQVFFDWNVRNARDLGGWKTYDGQTVKYRKIYRGGRLEGSTMSREGREAVLAEGIKAQLELRYTEDMLKFCALGENYAFCNPGIKNGGTAMLAAKAKTKQCFEFIVKCVRENKPVYFHCSLGRDRTGTMAALLLGVLGVVEGDISKEYELSYFAPRGWSIAYSESSHVFRNTRDKEYAGVANYLYNKGKKSDGTFERFDRCVELYLLDIGVSQQDIDDFRSLMLE